METSSKRLFKSRLDAKQDIWRAIPALMGDGNGNIEVPNQPNYVYIRIGDGDLGQAFNNRCQLRDNLAIFVGYDPVTDPDRRIFQVLTVRMADYAGAGNVTVPNVGQHHTTHEFGGGDDVYVDWRRLMGLRVGRPALFVVTVDPGYIFRAGAWMIIPSTTVDLTVTHAALVGSEAQYVLISLSGAGVVTATAGAVKGGLTLLAITDVPVPPAGHIPLAAVRLYVAQTSIGDTPSAPDIIDLRFPTTFTAGGSNVFGAGVANQFAYWSAADTLASSAEVARQINTCLLATKSVAALAAATYYIGLCAENTVNAAGAQAGHLLPIVSHLTAAGAAAYSGSMIGFEGWFDLSGAGTAALVRGLNYALQITANGTITNAAIVYGILNAGGAGGTITTGYGVLIGAPVGTIDTYYGIFIGSCAAATAKWAFYAEGDKITTKLAAAAGIELDPNAATGNFTLSLSPANLTGNHRVTFGDVTGTAALGAGTLTNATTNDVTVANHTHEITGTFTPSAHDLLSASHGDTLADGVVDGDVIIGNVTSVWSRLAISIPAANVRNVLGVDNGELRPSWKTALDATAPTTIAESAVAAAGTSLIFSHRDHTHGAPATWAATAHDLLSTTHGDTVAAVVQVGDIIVGQAGGWTALEYDGTAGSFLTTGITAPVWSDFYIDGTAGGRTTLAVTNTKTLTLTAVDDYNLTIPATGTAALLGIANVFTNTNQFTVIGISVAPNADIGVNIQPTSTLTAGSAYGINDILFTNPAGASSATFYGHRSGVRSLAACAQNFTGSFRGLESNVQHLGSGTLTSLYGFLATIAVDVGTVTTAYGLYVSAFTATTGGSFGTSYSIYTAGTEPVRIGGEVRVLGDTGGVASANTITGTSDLTANSTGVGTILFKGTTSRNSAGFIKIYIGTTAYYVPVFSAITG